MPLRKFESIFVGGICFFFSFLISFASACSKRLFCIVCSFWHRHGEMIVNKPNCLHRCCVLLLCQRFMLLLFTSFPFYRQFRLRLSRAFTLNSFFSLSFSLFSLFTNSLLCCLVVVLVQRYLVAHFNSSLKLLTNAVC